MPYVFGNEERQLYSAFLEPDGAKRRADLDAWIRSTVPKIQAVIKEELNTYINAITANMVTESGWRNMEEKFRRHQNDHHLVMDIKLRQLGSNEKYKGIIPTPVVHRTEIDLHGMYVDEAIQRVGKFITESYNACECQFWIIHGKGTGALREAVGQYLKQHSLVLSITPVDSGHGGEGAIKVEIKDRRKHYTPMK